MPRLTSVRRSAAYHRDRGGVATIVALLLAGGVLLGVTALAVDVGRVYAEREELQSGADAAAMDVAIDCVKHRTECDTYAASAEGAANANASDGVANVIEVCGYDVAGRLPACVAADAGNLTDCIGDLPATGVNYVQVRASTKAADGTYLLPFVFAQSLAGMSDTTSVGACARVAYGPPRSGFAATLSSCEYDYLMATAHEVDPPSWDGALPPAADEVVIGLHGDPATYCGGVPPSGWDQPGDFGWLDESGGPCQFLLTTGDSYSGDPGNNVSNTCRVELARLRSTREVVAVPVYDGFIDVAHTGHDYYHLQSLKAFVVTGYRLPGIHEESSVNSSFDPCRPSEACIYGYFVDVDFLPGSVGVSSGTDLGISVVQTIG